MNTNNKFAILHNSEEYGQILIKKDKTDDGYEITIEVSISGKRISTTLTADDKSSATEIFKEYENIRVAEKLVNDIIETLNIK